MGRVRTRSPATRSERRARARHDGATRPNTLRMSKRKSTPLDDPAEHVRKLVRHREAQCLSIVVAPDEQPPSSDVWEMCQQYVEDDFDSMDDDFNRNAAYVRAFAAVPSALTRWLEIGCGASATLTKLALHHGPRNLHVTAFEVNAQSARAATAELGRDKHRVHIVSGRSTAPGLLRQPTRRFDILLHEVFGSFASSEGCPQMLAHAREHYLVPRSKPSMHALCRSFHPVEFGRRRTHPGALSIPAQCGTFFTPCELHAGDLDACDTVLCDSHSRPKVVLASCAPLERLALSNSSATLELYDFHRGAALRTVQVREHEFVFVKDGVCNCLGVFIWVDLGVGGPSPDAKSVARVAGEARLPSRFPFGANVAATAGDERPGASGAPVRGAAPTSALNDFTSLCTPETLSSRTHATNWLNPLLLLPAPAHVKAGDRLSVRTRAAADTTRPGYAFEITLLRPSRVGGSKARSSTALGTLEVAFEDIYPDYGQPEGEGEDGSEDEWSEEEEDADA